MDKRGVTTDSLKQRMESIAFHANMKIIDLENSMALAQNKIHHLEKRANKLESICQYLMKENERLRGEADGSK